MSSLGAVLQAKLRAFGALLARRINALGYLRKWLLLGVLLGAIAGLGAVAFYAVLTFATHVFLGLVVGYTVPTPISEGGLSGSAALPPRGFLLPLVLAFGGLLSGLLVFTFAPEAEGHGTDAAIATVHQNPRGVRPRAVLVKIVASAITIGSGGSGGREGPIAQISAGFGSMLARVLDLSPADGRIAVSVGIGSGIGSIFGAPLGGALLSAELLYKEDIEVDTLLPGIIASIVGYTIFSAIYGFQPLFGFVASGYRFNDPLQLVWFALIGVLCGFVGLLYAKTFHYGASLFAKLRAARYVKPALGGLLVGLIALAIPQVLGTGYGWVEQGLRLQLLHIPLWIVLLLPFAKILATTLSIGSGGSGGIFGPGVVTGAFVGAAAWRLLAPIAPGVPHDPAAFVAVAMMACFGSIARVPFAMMLMVSEMTGSFEVLAPAMVAVGIAALIVSRFDETIYRGQLRRRADLPGARLAAGMPMVGSIAVAEAMSAPRYVAAADAPVSSAFEMLATQRLDGAPVVDEHGLYVGVLDRRRSADVGLDSTEPVGRLVDPTAPSSVLGANLGSALEALMSSGRNWVPVLDSHRRVSGILSTGDVVRAHRDALRRSLLIAPEAAAATSVIDTGLNERSVLAGKRLRDAGLPPGVIVVTLQRGTEVFLPRGETILAPGDKLSIIAPTERVDRLRRLLRPRAEPASSGLLGPFEQRGG